MLPASFQTPAAIILVLGGLLSCFAGYRVFRVVLGFFGFVLGALLTSSVMGMDQTAYMIVAAIVGGIVGALILVGAYFVGVALIGAGVGALAVNLIWASLGREPHIVIVILFAIAGALAALALQRYVIITATAFGGGWTTIVGALALTADQVALETAARNNVWLAYPMNPAPGQRWVVVAWLVLGLAGVIVQLAVTAKGKGKKKT
jgi:Domain of unknown function (DUF4203)